MPQTIYGDLTVKRTVNAERRVNQGLSKETLTTSRAVLINDYSWLKVVNASTQDVVLPDATTLSEGWSISVMVDSASGASTNVKTYHAVTPVLLKNILAGRAYSFTLVDNSTAAGVWQINYLEEADLLPTARYVDSFNATSDWSGPSGGYYTRTVTQATHGRGTSPAVQIFSGASEPYIHVDLDQTSIAANGDITVRVPSSPDLRFAGKMVLI